MTLRAEPQAVATPRVDMDAIRRYRLSAIQESMEVHGLDAIVAFEYANGRYIADLRPLWAPNFLVRQAAVIARGSDRVICFVHQDDTPHRRATMPWLEHDDVREFPTGTANFGGPIDAMAPLVSALRELAVDDGVVGVDIATVSVLDVMGRALAPRQIVDVGAAMRDVRVRKCPGELDIMRHASAVSDVAMTNAIASIEPGVRECDVLAVAMETLYRHNAEVPQCNLIVCSGPSTAPMQRYASERVIEPGDLVMLDIGGCFMGMFSELARTVVCGQASADQRGIFATTAAIRDATIGAIRAGATYREVQQAAGVPYLGSPYEGRMQRMIIAHGIGVGYAEAPFIPPPGGPEAPSTVLEEGTVLAVVPTILVPGVQGGGGVRLEDVVIVTDSGAELLTHVPLDEHLLQ